MATPNIHLGESFLDRLIKDTYNKNSLGDLSTEQMNELNAYIKSDDFKTKSQKFKSTDRTKFEGSMDHFFGKDTEKSRFYQNSLTNPDKTKYLIPRLTPSTPSTPSTPETPETPETPSTPGAPQTPSTPSTPGAPETPRTPSAPAVAGATHQRTGSEKPTKFSLDTFATNNKMQDFEVKVVDGKRYLRYDPKGAGDFWIDESKNIYNAPLFGIIGNKITGDTEFATTAQQIAYNELLTLLGKYKNGGIMNRINYFEQGGRTPQQGAQDMQQQIVALVQAAMQGDENANQTVNKIMEAAKQGDQQAIQLAQMIQAVVQQMKGQAVSAKWGSKLAYIRSLKYAKGGKACKKRKSCENGASLKIEEKACGGKAKKIKKKACGGKTMKVEEKACGGKAKKTKKCYFGGWF